MAQWVFGFLSGIAAYQAATSDGDLVVGDGLGRIDVDGIIHWMDTYCEANPLKTIGDAAGVLTLEVSKAH